MNRHLLQKQLNQTVPEPHPAFEARLRQTLDGLAIQQQAEPNPTTVNRRRLSGFARRVLLLTIVAVLLAGAAALASSLLHQSVFEVILGDTPVNAKGIMQYDLAKESFGDYDVEIRQAAYDGVSLYVVYSIRDRNATELLGVLDAEPDVYYITREALEAMESLEIGWWGSVFWIDGELVSYPALSSATVLGSETPGEMLFYNLFRLDQSGVYPDGSAVEIALPIGQKPSPETLRSREEAGDTAQPDAGLVTFTLDCSIRSGVTETHPNVTAELPFGSAQVLDAVYTPIQLYVTLGYTVTPDALAAFREAHSGGYEDGNGNIIAPFMENDVVSDWVSNLMLVDKDGNLVYDAYNPLREYGLLGYWNANAWFVFPYLEAYPAEMYLAPMTGSDADMSLAVRVR